MKERTLTHMKISHENIRLLKEQAKLTMGIVSGTDGWMKINDQNDFLTHVFLKWFSVQSHLCSIQ